MERTITRRIDPLCFPEKKSPPSPPPPPPSRLPQRSQRPAAIDAGRGEGGTRRHIHSSCSLTSVGFMLALHLLYINTDKAHQRGSEGPGCPDAAAEEIMSAVSITEINEWK